MRVDLRNAKLDNAILAQVNLSDSRVTGVPFTQAEGMIAQQKQ